MTFEFEDPAVVAGTTGTNVPIVFSAADTQAILATAIVTAIRSEITLGNLTGVNPQDLRDGRIHLGGTTSNTINVTTVPALSVTGTPGVATPGAFAVPFVPSASFTSNDIARAIASAINGSGTALSSLASGSRVRLNGERDIRFGTGVTTLSKSVQGRFDTGPVLKVTTSAAAIGDGQSFTIRDDRGLVRKFEFDRNGVLRDPSATSIPITGLETAAEIAQKVVAEVNKPSVNAAGFRVVAAALDDTIYLTNDRNVALDPQLRAVSAISQGLVISSAIDAQAYAFDLPGGNDDPGHRDLPEEVGGSAEQHINQSFGALGRDATAGATTIFYNFRPDYGVDPQGTALLNAITPEHGTNEPAKHSNYGVNILAFSFSSQRARG